MNGSLKVWNKPIIANNLEAVCTQSFLSKFSTTVYWGLSWLWSLLCDQQPSVQNKRIKLQMNFALEEEKISDGTEANPNVI